MIASIPHCICPSAHSLPFIIHPHNFTPRPSTQPGRVCQMTQAINFSFFSRLSRPAKPECVRQCFCVCMCVCMHLISSSLAVLTWWVCWHIVSLGWWCWGRGGDSSNSYIIPYIQPENRSTPVHNNFPKTPFALCTLISYNQHESHRLATPPPLFLCPSHLSVNLINRFPSSWGASSLFCGASFLF